MSFEAHDKHIYELFSRSQYFIPRNQRRYVWSQRNWQELLDDIMLVQNGRELTHFIGSIVLYSDKDRENGISHYIIIDGQQRITTLSIILASVAFWLKCYKAEDAFNGTKQYIMAHDDLDKDHIMVTSDDNLSLGRILEGIIGTPAEHLQCFSIESFLNAHTVSKKDKNIVAAFKFYMEKIGDEITKSRKKPVNYLTGLRDTIVNKILYVSIIASSEEDACTVFEILNARGSVLDDHELLKNFIMRGMRPEGDVDRAKTIWDEIERDLGTNIGRFVKHYATHRYRDSVQDGRSDYMTIQSANKNKSAEELLYDLRSKATYYCKIINPIMDGDEANCSQTEYLVYSFFKKKRHEQIRPVLLSLIHQNDIGNLSTEKYEETILYLYDFVICYSIIGQESSNKITNIVYAMAKGLENEYSDTLLQEFISNLNEKLPGKENFNNAFALVGWSHHGGFYDDDKDKERVKIVLEAMERHKNASNRCGDFTIEHIIDDADDTQNGKIGNLIPLEKQLNEKCNGKTFKEKLKIYAQSSFQTARSIADRYEKGQFDIDARTRCMADEFYENILKFKIGNTLRQEKNNMRKKKAASNIQERKTIGEIVAVKMSGKQIPAIEQNMQMTIFDLM